MNKSEILNKLLNTNYIFSGRISIDSRDIESGDIFFAINKGNEYIKEAIDKNAFVVYDKKSDIEYKNALYVKDTVSFMQELAREYRKYLKAVVIAITGSNGKTTTKDILASLLSAYKTSGNYNNHIGLPYTLLNADLDSKYIVLELGMSHVGEIDLLASICKPDYSIIVNIGDSHIEFLKTRQKIFEAKSEIIKHTKNKVVVNNEDEYLTQLSGNNILKVNTKDVLIDDLGTSFFYNNKKYHINLYGKHNAINASLCIEVLNQLNVKVDLEKLNNLKISKMRFEIVKKDENIYINDSYNAAPKSMECSLLSLNEIFKDKEKVLILADMLELGENEVKYHKDLKNILEKITYKKLYLYGPLMSNIDISATKTNDLLSIKKEISMLKDKVIFLKGSRGMRLEKIMESDK
ncbi:UDP-N-acetylmuramoyl-tripeptide--D-alanyl-D-alanine ligase [Oceanivirga miroungae]|uniref:UDP-N-acetylmuramoyl-tripeptide--D-alanyl-D-alanine ligase n=1 Tax=Oceanivirga miroungae TaxID=1130046 RepID=A0A6I8ME12_9FUSO|nr:UDP-N-acetylmuramoyl-tripeptide--D-alanyl-D-alanine ligase [Oceanivirga miroungae]VWL85798.1 UDP-N-acetylmuramoylalanyl-D-glutamyl-2, 6-diaminopimelate-D-alanyl-D-alanyl ligase [Oceanivirga miroungae]